MKKVTVSLLLSAVLTISTFAQELKLEGIYQGENLFVMNPFASTGVGFCIFEVSVNGQITTDEINSSAFEVDLTVFDLQKGERIEIKIKHKDDCKPKVLNEDVLKPRSTFTVTSINVDKDGTLKWTTIEENGKLPFVAEQYRWKKWVRVGEIEGKGTQGPNDYSMKVKFHSGTNRFRVKQVDYKRKPRYSLEATIRTLLAPVTHSPKKKVDDEISFTDETMYEIYDYFGNIVLKGYGKNVDVSSLKKGQYFLNYDNIMEKFTKK